MQIQSLETLFVRQKQSNYCICLIRLLSNFTTKTKSEKHHRLEVFLQYCHIWSKPAHIWILHPNNNNNKYFFSSLVFTGLCILSFRLFTNFFSNLESDYLIVSIHSIPDFVTIPIIHSRRQFYISAKLCPHVSYYWYQLPEDTHMQNLELQSFYESIGISPPAYKYDKMGASLFVTFTVELEGFIQPHSFSINGKQK